MQTIAILAILSGCGSPEATPSTAAPEASAAQVEAPAPASSALVSGVISVPADAPEAKAVFVSVRAVGRPGPPLAARRLPAGPFPLSFTLTEADRPMDLGPIPDQLQLKVALDVDGDPMAKSEGDLVSVTDIAKGATEVSVMLGAP